MARGRTIRDPILSEVEMLVQHELEELLVRRALAWKRLEMLSVSACERLIDSVRKVKNIGDWQMYVGKQ